MEHRPRQNRWLVALVIWVILWVAVTGYALGQVITTN